MSQLLYIARNGDPSNQIGAGEIPPANIPSAMIQCASDPRLGIARGEMAPGGCCIYRRSGSQPIKQEKVEVAGRWGAKAILLGLEFGALHVIIYTPESNVVGARILFYLAILVQFSQISVLNITSFTLIGATLDGLLEFLAMC